MKDIQPANDCLLRLSQVLERLSISRTTLRRWIHDGRFPAGVKLTSRTTVWPKSVVDQWIAVNVLGGTL